MTFRQAQELGGHVRRGERGSLVVYADRIHKTEIDENTGQEVEREIAFLKGYTGFCVEQIDGLPERFYARAQARLEPMERIGHAERFFAGTGAQIRHGGNMAFYSVSEDRVQMPPFETFRDAESYYATLAHELTHWTGHPNRLGRDLAGRDRGRIRERGPFPAFDRDKFLKAKFIKTLPEDIQQDIAEHGIRNGVLLTIAPTGTTSAYYNNVSSGLEPTFDWKYERKVRQSDGSIKNFGEVYDYGYLVFKSIHGEVDEKDFPEYMVSSYDLTVKDHLNIQATCQRFIDASISKTINCPSDMPFEDFQNVYTMAYEMGCKGCTTYRPSGVRGSVLSVEPDGSATLEVDLDPVSVQRGAARVVACRSWAISTPMRWPMRLKMWAGSMPKWRNP
jgi:hypothetical protein